MRFGSPVRAVCDAQEQSRARKSGVGIGAEWLCRTRSGARQSKYVRLYSEFYPDKPRVGLQDAIVRAIIILAGGNRGKR